MSKTIYTARGKSDKAIVLWKHANNASVVGGGVCGGKDLG